MRARRCTTSPSSARAQPVSRRRCTRPAPDSPPRYSSASPPAASAPKPSTWRTTPATPDPPAASSYPWTCTIRPSPSGRRPSWKTSPPWTSPPSPTSSSRPSTPTSPARSSWPRARWPANSGCPARMSCAAAAYPIAPPATATSIATRTWWSWAAATRRRPTSSTSRASAARCTWCTGATSCGPRPSTMNAYANSATSSFAGTALPRSSSRARTGA